LSRFQQQGADRGMRSPEALVPVPRDIVVGTPPARSVEGRRLQGPRAFVVDRRGAALRRRPQGSPASSSSGATVDVLDASPATPIPRTLNQAMTGIPRHLDALRPAPAAEGS
jgi:hypothetical protein